MFAIVEVLKILTQFALDSHATQMFDEGQPIGHKCPTCISLARAWEILEKAS